MYALAPLLVALLASVVHADTCPHCQGKLPEPQVVTRWHYVPVPIPLSREGHVLSDDRCPCQTLARDCPCAGDRHRRPDEQTPPVIIVVVRHERPTLIHRWRPRWRGR